MISKTQHILSQEEMLGLFWLFIVGADDGIPTGFSTDGPTSHIRILDDFPEYQEQKKYASQYPYFTFCKEAGLFLQDVGWHQCSVGYTDWKCFKQWMLSYLSAYQEGSLLPNGSFLSSKNSQEKTKEILEKYKDIFGLSFNLYRKCEVDGEVLRIPLCVRIFEDLLLLKNSGVIDLSVGDLEHQIEYFEWPEIRVRILQPILTSLTGAISYLGINITQNDEVYFDGRKIQINPASDQFKLLKMVVQAQGHKISVFDVYQALEYKKRKRKKYQFEEYGGTKKKKSKNNLNKTKNDRLRKTISRLLARFEPHSLEITSAQGSGVILKTAD